MTSPCIYLQNIQIKTIFLKTTYVGFEILTVINFSEVEYCALPQLRFKFKFQVKV